MKERDSMWKNRFAPRWIALKALQGEARGRFVPLDSLSPAGDMEEGGRCRSAPFSMGGYGNIFGVCVDGQNIRARICNARRDTQSATISWKRLLTQLSLSATFLSESRFSPIFLQVPNKPKF